MRIVLTIPPSDNERLIFARNLQRFILSKKYREYKKQAQHELMILKCKFNFDIVRPTYENQLKVTIMPYMPNKRRDSHGMLKPLLDVMEGTIYDNDRWIVPVFLPAEVDVNHPRVEVEI